MVRKEFDGENIARSGSNVNHEICPLLDMIMHFYKILLPPSIIRKKKEAYVKEIMKASLERLARLIKVCGFLLQTKVYLFWKNLNV